MFIYAHIFKNYIVLHQEPSIVGYFKPLTTQSFSIQLFGTVVERAPLVPPGPLRTFHLPSPLGSRDIDHGGGETREPDSE